MKRSGANFLAVLIITLAMMIAGCSPTVQSTGPKKDVGTEQDGSGGQNGQNDKDASSSGSDYDAVELSDAEFEVDEDADWPGPGEDLDTSWDPDGGYQPTNTCEKQKLTECFFNSDCADPSHSCQEIDEEMPTKCCAPGPRGNLGFGEDCSGNGSEEANNEACASALCLDNGTEAVCSQACNDGDEDCPTGSECVGMAGLGGLCVPEGFDL